ncbi:hypothetical protein [Streptomyces sp. NPDC005017]|uniref:hypothetical protein n=1 Tax=Streptomyces sp. NPDC005017 TaxID=3364706 RepID=UPI003695C260
MTGSAAAEATARTGRGDEAWLRREVTRWLLFSLVCACGSLGLAWLAPVVPLPGPLRAVAVLVAWVVLPLASVLVPLLLLRRVPRGRRKVAWQLVVPVVAGVALGVVGKEAGDQVALEARGRWADVEVVRVEKAGTDHCDLRTADGREVSPSLSEGDGCDDPIAKGDRLRVRYDPEGVAGPTGDADATSYGGLIAGLFLAAVAMGTWGGVRQSRWNREYVG